jgi:hypothetical protein
MPSDSTLQALRDTSPRSQLGFQESIARYDALRLQIIATPVPSRRRLAERTSRRRLIGLSAAAAVALSLAAVVVGLAVSATSPPSAIAAARKALAATAASGSGTMTMTTTGHGSTIWALDSTRWNGDDIAMTTGANHQLGPNQQLLLIGGGAYVETAGGHWIHYANESDVGPKLGPAVQLAHDNVVGSTAERILGLATGLQKTAQTDGTTVYTGTIPNSTGDPGISPTDDAITRMITGLRSGNEAGAPGGYHNDLQLKMTVASNGLVRQISLTLQQQGTNSPTDAGATTWTVTYSRLGNTRPITPPADSTPAAPGVALRPAATGPKPTTNPPCGAVDIGAASCQ